MRVNLASKIAAHWNEQLELQGGQVGFENLQKKIQATSYYLVHIDTAHSWIIVQEFFINVVNYDQHLHAAGWINLFIVFRIKKRKKRK